MPARRPASPCRCWPVRIASRSVISAATSRLRRTQVAFEDAEVVAVDELPEAARVAGAAVVLRWRLEVEPGGRVEREWTVWADEAPSSRRRPAPRPRSASTRVRRPTVDEAAGAPAYHTWRAGMAAVASGQRAVRPARRAG